MASRVAQLVKLVTRKTISNEIRWERTEKEGVFQHAFPNYVVRFSERFVPDHSYPDYVLAILNQDGEIIEEITDPDAEREGLEEAYVTMREAYEMARRQAMGIERALDDLLRYLDAQD